MRVINQRKLDKRPAQRDPSKQKANKEERNALPQRGKQVKAMGISIDPPLVSFPSYFSITHYFCYLTLRRVLPRPPCDGAWSAGSMATVWRPQRSRSVNLVFMGTDGLVRPLLTRFYIDLYIDILLLHSLTLAFYSVFILSYPNRKRKVRAVDHPQNWLCQMIRLF